MDEDRDNSMERASSNELIPPCSSNIDDDIFGPSPLDPPIGHEYQVEISPVINESERIQLRRNRANAEDSYPFMCDFSVPTVWVCNEVEDSGPEENDGTSSVGVHAEAADAKKSSMSDDGTDSRTTTSQSVITENNKGVQLRKRKIYAIFPGIATNPWSDSDVKSFVLGLFIFGRNFTQIKLFLEIKGMGDILSFYYGKFYKSAEYRRWRRCKKMKGKRCRTGRKLFAGQRQHELLSRLNRHVSEEVQATLQQISKSFTEGTTSLEKYVSSLKSAVGLGVLVEAVGIGKGKEDLTSLPVKSSKNNKVFSLPTTKALSSLGPSDILKILTGGFRLSKAKSNDLFWEAVWPRLLARGWHSELPNNQGYIGSKDFLVFLIPGVKKFSRRKLVKGDHYFVSISDVLNKVTAEPSLLELEGEEAKADSSNDEEMENGLDESDQSDHRRHRYLKPRASTNNTNVMKFMVIDTSLVDGGNSSDIRELKPFPVNSVGKIEADSVTITYNRGDKCISKANPSKGSLDSKKPTPFTVVDTSFPDEGSSSKVRELRCPLVEFEDPSKKTGIAGASDTSSSSSERESSIPVHFEKNIRNANSLKGTHSRDATVRKEVYGSNLDDNAKRVAGSCQNQKDGLPYGNKPKQTIKHQFCRKTRSNLGVHPIKRRRLTACVKSETSRLLENSLGGIRSEKLEVSQSPNFPNANKNLDDPVSHEQNAGSVSSSAEGSAEENGEGTILNSFCLDKGISCVKVEKCDSKPPISSEAPQVPPKSEDGEIVVMVEQEEQWQKQNDSKPSCDVEMPPTTSRDVGSAEKTDTNPKRQSTRNRPMTARALECIANEYLHVKSRQKRTGIQKAKDPLRNLTCETPKPLIKYREEELQNLRGDGKGQLQEWAGSMIMRSTMILEIRIRVHNMLVRFLEGLVNTPTLVEEGLADHLQNQVRISYSFFSHLFRIALISLWKTGHLKLADFLPYALKSTVQVLKPELESVFDSTPNQFDSFEDVLKLYEGGIEVPQGMLKGIRENVPMEMLKEIFRPDGERYLKFPIPQVIAG